MKNLGLLKVTGAIMLLGAVIVTVSIGTGATAREIDKKSAAAGSGTQVEKTEKQITEKKEETAPKAELMSEFETEFETDVNRDINLKLACSKLNGMQIEPGGTLSFLEVAGPITKEEGYVDGPVVVDGTKLGSGVGGGICQVSTTLYNAALKANMGIQERTRHSFPMNYVSVGLDASVSSPDVDLKIQNTTEEAVYIFASVENNRVNIKLYGKKAKENSEIRINSLVKQEIKPAGEEIQLDASLNPGERNVIQEERTGYEVEVYREYYEEGKLVNKELVSEDTYPAIQRIVIEGNTNISK